MAVDDTHVRLDCQLITGEVRRVHLGTHTGTLGNALDRLEDWVEADDGSWLQKRYIVRASVVRDPGAQP